MSLADLIAHLGPTLTAIASGWFGMKAVTASNLSKKQFDEIKDELGTIQKSVETVQEVGEENNKKINEVNEKLAVHDEAHLVTMYLRLERDINTALKRGHTSVHESDVIHKMHQSYKKLGGNGYIDALFNKYIKLEVREQL
nr:MAG TPA: hypothetical protein [Caudoviricetes sp.]